jgi:hypothetical protein
MILCRLVVAVIPAVALASYGQSGQHLLTSIEGYPMNRTVLSTFCVPLVLLAAPTQAAEPKNLLENPSL